MEEKAARRSDWDLQDMPIKHASLKMKRAFSNQQMERLKKGFIPMSQDDKWFVFYEDGTLYFHRSWTGFCIYMVRFEKVGDIYSVQEVLVNRNQDQYTMTNDEIDLEVLKTMIDGLARE